MTSGSVTLPVVSEAPLCADFARDNAVNPAGTALAPDVLVLVEVPEPWPKPAGKHPDLAPLLRAAARHPQRVRFLAARPHDPNRRRLIAFRPAPGGMTRTERRVGDDVNRDLAAILGPQRVEVSVESAERTVLICTQGSHDVCCGTWGGRLADAAETELGDIEIFRVSHTGGHRFAPTAMTLPDGRMWAYLTRDRLAAILERSADAADAAATCRGWWGAPSGPEQAAERAVFASVGWDLDAEPRTVTSQMAENGNIAVTVATETGGWTVAVEPGREVPSIKCDKPGGLPVKTSREWIVSSIVRNGG